MHNKIKNNLIATTAFAVSLVTGYSRRSYAAPYCDVGTYANYVCSGTYTNEVQFNGYGNGTVNITTAPGFSINAPGSSGLTIRGLGRLIFTDTTGSSITAAYHGLYINNYGNHPGGMAGTISVDSNSNINAGMNGAYILSGGSDGMNVTLSGDITGGSRGVFALNSGSGSMSLNLNGTVTGNYYYGVRADNSFNGTDLNITTGASSNIVSANTGIFALHNGHGALSIDINGDINSAFTSIYARGRGTETSIRLGTDSELHSTYGGGIQVQNYSGYLNIITASTSSINVGGGAIYASNSGYGATSHLVIGGDIYARNGSGINASNQPGTADLYIYTEASSHINAGAAGIFSYNRGNGDTHIFSNGYVAGRNGYGISAFTTSADSDTNITTGTGSFVSGRVTGIYALNATAGTGNISLNINGEVHGRDNNGVSILNYSGATSITTSGDSEITGNNNGISINHTGTGALSMSLSGSVSGITGVNIANRGSTAGSLYINGTIDGTGGNAIVFRNDLAGTQYNTTATPIEIAGGRIIGNILDYHKDRGFSPVTVTGDFISEGNFTVSDFDVAAGGDFTLSADNAIYSGNSVSLDGTFTLGGNNAYIRTNYGITNSGTFNVSGNNTRAYGDFTNNGTLHIGTGHNFFVDTMTAGTGDIWFGFNTESDHAQLTVTNSAADLTGQTLHINVTGTTGFGNNQQALLVSSYGDIIGGPGGTRTQVDDNSVLWDFDIVDGTGAINPTDASQLFLLARQSASVGGLSFTQNNENVGNVLMSLQSTTNPELASIVANMNAASTDAAFNEVLESVQSAADMSDFSAMSASTTRVMDTISSRMDFLRDIKVTQESKTSLTETDQEIAMPKGLQAWAVSFGDADNAGSRDYGLSNINGGTFSGFGSYIRQDARSGIAGYDAKSAGAAFGVDTGHSFNDLILGASFAYAHTEINSKNANRGENDIDAFQLLGYVGKTFEQNRFWEVQASYAQAQNDTTRHDVGSVPGLTAKGDFTSREFGLRGRVGKHIRHDDYLITPSLGIDWLHYMADSYTETGAGGANLSVDTKNLDQVEIGGTVKVQRSIKRDNGATITPEIHAGYFYNLTGDALQKTSSFTGGGASFATESPDPARSRVTAGFGVTYQGTQGWDYALNYDTNLRNDYQEHSLIARASWKF